MNTELYNDEHNSVNFPTFRNTGFMETQQYLR